MSRRRLTAAEREVEALGSLVHEMKTILEQRGADNALSQAHRIMFARCVVVLQRMAVALPDYPREPAPGAAGEGER